MRKLTRPCRKDHQAFAALCKKEALRLRHLDAAFVSHLPGGRRTFAALTRQNGKLLRRVARSNRNQRRRIWGRPPQKEVGLQSSPHARRSTQYQLQTITNQMTGRVTGGFYQAERTVVLFRSVGMEGIRQPVADEL
ncbi:MAG: hypothetical protein WB676_17640 [Bryobacteraceae bacterium]